MNPAKNVGNHLVVVQQNIQHVKNVTLPRVYVNQKLALNVGMHLVDANRLKR
jgi:hypothetical protein